MRFLERNITFTKIESFLNTLKFTKCDPAPPNEPEVARWSFPADGTAAYYRESEGTLAFYRASAFQQYPDELNRVSGSKVMGGRMLNAGILFTVLR